MNGSQHFGEACRASVDVSAHTDRPICTRLAIEYGSVVHIEIELYHSKPPAFLVSLGKEMKQPSTP